MNKFYTFTGVVEDRHDPEKLGRVRVRCFGLHSESKTDIPTEDLPWAQPLLPVTQSGISGLGVSPPFLSMVLGCLVILEMARVISSL